MPLPGQARREKAALNLMFDRYLTARWKQTVDLTFARLPDHAIAGDEATSRATSGLSSSARSTAARACANRQRPVAAAPAGEDDTLASE